MKNLFIGILLLVFAAGTFQELSFYALYKLNQEYITSEYCINKNKPELNCKGSCHFQATVQQANEEKADNPFLQFKRIEMVVSQVLIKEFNSLLDFSSTKLIDLHFFTSSSHIDDLLRPPQY